MSALLFLVITLVLSIDSTISQVLIKSVNLTTTNTKQLGARITLPGINNDASIGSFGTSFNIAVGSDVTDQQGYHFEINLDNTWGFDSETTSTIMFTMYSNTETSAFSDLDLILSFSVNSSEYFTMIIRLDGGGPNNAYPDCDTTYPPTELFAEGDVKQLVDGESTSSECTVSRECKSMGGTPYGHAALPNNYPEFPPKFPITITLVNNPIDNWSYFTISSPQWPSNFVQQCGFVAFQADSGLQIYIALDDEGESISFQKFNIQYLLESSAAPTTKSPTTGSPTSASPTTITPTTSQPTTSPITLMPSTLNPTTSSPTLMPTTVEPTLAPTTSNPTTKTPSTITPTVFPTDRDVGITESASTTILTDKTATIDSEGSNLNDNVSDSVVIGLSVSLSAVVLLFIIVCIAFCIRKKKGSKFNFTFTKASSEGQGGFDDRHIPNALTKVSSIGSSDDDLDNDTRNKTGRNFMTPMGADHEFDGEEIDGNMDTLAVIPSGNNNITPQAPPIDIMDDAQADLLVSAMMFNNEQTKGNIGGDNGIELAVQKSVVIPQLPDDTDEEDDDPDLPDEPQFNEDNILDNMDINSQRLLDAKKLTAAIGEDVMNDVDNDNDNESDNDVISPQTQTQTTKGNLDDMESSNSESSSSVGDDDADGQIVISMNDNGLIGNKYLWIESALKQCDSKEWKKYLDKFKKNKMTDDRLKHITFNICGKN